MTLSASSRLGPYEIVALIGAGGMGEVYRARDSRLGRDVAIKVLPGRLSADPEIRARFEREAQAISQLNHPHICTLYDIGRQDDIDYLVMEHLEGETLAARLTKGPLPPAEALRCGIEIANALDCAHRSGIVHRDLKPGNVMLTKGGAKLMDFGLARATGLPPVAGALSQSPTVSRPLTAEGMMIGTFQYMAPEQLEGKEADARSDLWALGCVLYEMATAKRAFEGASQASLIAAILKEEPRPISDLQPLTPPALERTARQCLMKDPDERWQSARDVASELRWIASSGVESTPSAWPPGRAPRKRGWSGWVLAAAIAFGVLTLGIIALWRADDGTANGSRLQAAMSSEVWLFASHGANSERVSPRDVGSLSPVWAPDGHSFVYTSNLAGRYDIYRHKTGRATDAELVQALDTMFKFPYSFTPNGTSLIIVADDPKGWCYWTVPLQENGSPSRLLNTIVWEAEAAVSPDGRWLACLSGEWERPDIYIMSFPAGAQRIRVSPRGGKHPMWTRGGRELLYLSSQGRETAVMSVPIEIGRELTAGAPRPILTRRDLVSCAVTRDGDRLLLSRGPARYRRHTFSSSSTGLVRCGLDRFLARDFDLLYRFIANDPGFLEVHPDSAVVKGFEEFKKAERL